MLWGVPIGAMGCDVPSLVLWGVQCTLIGASLALLGVGMLDHQCYVHALMNQLCSISHDQPHMYSNHMSSLNYAMYMGHLWI